MKIKMLKGIGLMSQRRTVEVKPLGRIVAFCFDKKSSVSFSSKRR